MEYANIIYTKEDGIGVITLNRPQVYNALCDALNDDMLCALGEIEKDPDIRALIITGGPRAFAAGADIGEMLSADAFAALRVCGKGHSINDRLEQLPIPVIAAVNKMALGGGLELALACDFRVAGESSIFALPETGLGIIPGAGGTQRLTRLIGPARAKEMVMLGKRVRGREAFEIGLVTEVVDDDRVQAAALALANSLKEKPAAALALAKSAINHGADYDSAVGKAMERALFALSFAGGDQKEGMNAFVEKRQPEFGHRR